MRNKLIQRGLWEGYRDFMASHLRACESELDTSSVFIINEKILSMFGGKDVPQNVANDMVEALLRCAVPGDDERFPWLFKRSTDFTRARRLTASLDASALITASRKARISLVTASRPQESSGGKPKQRAAKKTLRKPKGAEETVANVVGTETVTENDGRLRVVTYDEDLRNAIYGQVSCLPPHQVQREVVLRALAIGIAFGVEDNMPKHSVFIKHLALAGRCSRF